MITSIQKLCFLLLNQPFVFCLVLSGLTLSLGQRRWYFSQTQLSTRFSRPASTSRVTSSAPAHTAATPSALTRLVTQLTDPSIITRLQTERITEIRQSSPPSNVLGLVDLLLTTMSYFADIWLTFCRYSNNFFCLPIIGHAN